MSKSLVRGFDWSCIKQIRMTRAWSQEGLAGEIGVDRKQVTRWEHGVCPRPEARAALFRALPELQQRYMVFLTNVVGTNSPESVPYNC